MKIKTLTIHPYTNSMRNGILREGFLLHLIDEQGNESCGDVAPLPKRSRETLHQVILQFQQKQNEIVQINWSLDNYIQHLQQLCLFPSFLFGLESALLAILDPLSDHTVKTSILFMGSLDEIIMESQTRALEGYTSAKVKVGQLNFRDATTVIHQLKDKFHLRIDVNRAWSTPDSLQFFQQFPLNSFDYIEEPFQNPRDLSLFPHPLAVDESFPDEISFNDLELFPTLKAMIYKPTIQGGLIGCYPLYKWCTKNEVQFVLSSSFESKVGLAHITAMASRLSISTPIGLGID